MSRYFKSLITQTSKDILIRFPKKIVKIGEFLKELKTFKKMNDNRFSVNISDLYPCLNDKVKSTPFDQHYIYHPAWAARILAKTQPAEHVDFSSILYFSTIISAFIPVKFYDYRPADLNITNWQGGSVDLCKLPFETNSLVSVSCMHTIEHIGLGRYGDSIDPEGDIKAINEIIRVTKPKGDILFVTPVGMQKIEFNGHRIYSYETVTRMFEKCEIISFSLIPDEGGIIENADIELVKNQIYGCGCFWFKKKIITI